MQEPKLPQDEEKRIENLHRLEILDSEPEERFDRLTRLARRLFNVPIALVSLVDVSRQWFKSCYGLDAKETHRKISFCGHTILEDDLFIVPDATKDERFADNPLVINEPKIRFYCGYPLKYEDGTKLGTLCIIDIKPRTLDEDEIQALKDLGAMAEQELSAIKTSTVDELTGISNRRGFNYLAGISLKMLSRVKSSACLVLIDLNNFKPINDKFGHAEGDKALKTFAGMLLSSFRKSDIIARLGGDEFVLCMNNTTLAEAETAMLNFTEVINIYNEEAHCGYDLEFSQGIVPIDSDLNKSLDDYLQQADQLMYKNKKSR